MNCSKLKLDQMLETGPLTRSARAPCADAAKSFQVFYNKKVKKSEAAIHCTSRIEDQVCTLDVRLYSTSYRMFVLPKSKNSAVVFAAYSNQSIIK